MKRLKNILLSVLVISGVVTLTASVTTAIFSANAVSTNNTFSTGALTIELNGLNNAGEPINDGPFFTANNLVPGGEPAVSYVEIKNTGTMDAIFRTWVTDVVQDVDLDTRLEIQVTQLTDEHNPDNYIPVSGGTLYSPEVGVPYKSFADGLVLSDIRGSHNALDNVNASLGSEQNPLSPNEVAVYKIEVRLALWAESWYQNRTLTSSLRVNAVQALGQDAATFSW